MIIELGHFALYMTFALGILIAGLGLYATIYLRCSKTYAQTVSDLRKQNRAPKLPGIFAGTLKKLTFFQVFLGVFSFACLVYAFVIGDWSVTYVVQTSYDSLPLLYRLTAAWGGHEGSVLLWVVILMVWSALLAKRSYVLPKNWQIALMMTMAILTIAFLSFILFTSNPFLREFAEMPLEGAGLNPLLQDPGFLIHPPMLYLGYVGSSVPFAFAIAALINRKSNINWAAAMRPWVLSAWGFLTLGIMLGSWWAYNELGWGGFWFWDPVENASLMPWLTGTALLHTTWVAAKQRGHLIRWTLLLAILTFGMSLLGTFLVRSGILTSVHAFANDPVRGVYILMIFMVLIGGALLLYSMRTPENTNLKNSLPFFARENLLAINSIFFMILTVIVVLGTIGPLVHDLLGQGKISVGPPYFNQLFSIWIIPILLGMAVAPRTFWRETRHNRLIQQLSPVVKGWLVLVTIAIGFIYLASLSADASPWFAWTAWPSWAALIFALLVLAQVLHGFYEVYSLKKRRASKQTLGQKTGMQLAHLGVAVMLIGIACQGVLSIEKQVKLSPGESVTIDDYQVFFKSLNTYEGPNYDAIKADFSVWQDRSVIKTLTPEKRTYHARDMTMTESATHITWQHDLYLALGEPLDGNAWALRVYIKSAVRWIWAGAIMMALGAFLTATMRIPFKQPRRKHYQPKRSRKS